MYLFCNFCWQFTVILSLTTTIFLSCFLLFTVEDLYWFGSIYSLERQTLKKFPKRKCVFSMTINWLNFSGGTRINMHQHTQTHLARSCGAWHFQRYRIKFMKTTQTIYWPYNVCMVCIRCFWPTLKTYIKCVCVSYLESLVNLISGKEGWIGERSLASCVTQNLCQIPCLNVDQNYVIH